jgi:hypothetical protein
MISAMSDLWRVPPPGPDDILTHPAFERLRESCRDGYPSAGKKGPAFALATALRALGLPCDLQKETAYLSLPADQAARRLDAAMRATRAKRVHLVPLDLAADLPSIAFGSATLGRLTADELRTLVDEARLKRLLPRQTFDAERFSEFHWLVVEETVPLDQEPEARAVPVLFMDLSQDLGRIEPQKGRFLGAVEEALFFLLLAPWESWSTMPEFDWRGFRVPWVYTVDSDLFIRLNAPPSPDTLSWEDRIYDDGHGGSYEEEWPIKLPLEDDVATGLLILDQSRWTVVEQAKRSVLFETPVAHFLVRAFLSEGVDEFLAHITTVEAALGLRADYQRSFRVAPDRHKGMRATNTMKGRIAGLLGDLQYERLFDKRSAFLRADPDRGHGREASQASRRVRRSAPAARRSAQRDWYGTGHLRRNLAQIRPDRHRRIP